MAEPTGKTYEITTLADLFAIVTTDNVQALNKDIYLVLKNVANAKELAQAAGIPANAYAFAPTIKWTDDNVAELTNHIQDDQGNTLLTVKATRVDD